MPNARAAGRALARLAPLAAVLLAALGCLPACEAAPREERTACLLLDGRLVRVAEIAADAASHGARLTRYDGDEAFFLAAALRARDPAATIAFPDDERGSLIAFSADGLVRVFFIEADCLRATAAIAPEVWESALRLAFGDPT